MTRLALPSMRRRGCRTFMFAGLLAIAVAPAAALAQGTAEQKTACAPDAMRLCVSALPDVSKITACMQAHVAELSPRCRAQFATGPEKAPAAARTADRPATKAAPRAATKLAKREPRIATPEPRRAPAPRHPSETATASRIAPPMRRPRAMARAEPRDETGAEMPEREDAPVLRVAPEAELSGAAGAPAPDRPALSAAQASLLASCRAGLIDSFTCSNTIRVFGLDDE